MDEFGSQYVSDLRDALTTFLTDTAKYIRVEGPLPKADSIADTERKTCPRPESIVTAFTIAHNLIESGGEHISAFVKTITEPVEVIACWTCVRSMLESCALAAWLLDPKIDAKERIGRTFALRYEGMSEQLKFGKVAGIIQADMDAVEKQIVDLEQAALSLGFAPVRNRKNERIAIVRPMPKATEIIRMMLDQEKHYRLLSAVAHGHQWAVIQLTLSPTADQSEIAFENVSTTRFEKVVKPDGIAVLGLCAFKALSRALWNQSEFLGWKMLSLDEILDNTADKLQMNRQHRFWRS